MNDQKSRKYLRAGRNCLQKEKYGEAMSHFVLLANVKPTLKSEFEDDFVTALCKWIAVLEKHGEIDKMMTCFQQGMGLFPKNELLLNNIGASLLKLGLTDEAASMFRRTLKLNPLNITAKEGLESVSSALVERWHFRMLNDKQRNKAYKCAIARAVGRGCDTVLDIGSGTGILSMFAVQAGAKNVYACEMSKTMFELSLDVIQANNMQESIQLIHKKSTDLIIGEDLPKISLVVTETLDCGLLGEGILKTMTHAWQSLLKPTEEGRDLEDSGVSKKSNHGCVSPQVIPCGAVLYAQGIESRDIRNQSHCQSKLSCFDVGSLVIIGGEKLEKDESEGIEPYTTECLDTLQHGYKALTQVFKVQEYNFSCPDNLTRKQHFNICVPVVQTGSLDAVAMWFDLHLDDQVTISTAPGRGSLCWEQAIFPVYTHHISKTLSGDNDLALNVGIGEYVSIECTLTSDCVRLQCTDVMKSASASTNENMTKVMNNMPTYEDSINVETQIAEELNDITMCDDHITVIPPPNMLRLNDTCYNTAWKNSIEQAIKNIHKKRKGCKVIDLTRGKMHLKALEASHAGAENILLPNADKPSHATEAIRRHNNLQDCIHYGGITLEEAASQQGCGWDVLLSEVVEPSGILEQGVIQDIIFSRGCLLMKEGVILPRTLTAYAVCIESQDIMNFSKVVSDDNTLGLDIARFINAFSVSTHVNIDLATLKHTHLSDEFELFMLDFMMSYDDDEQILAMLETTRQHMVKILRDGTIQALPYWFNIGLDESHMLSTYSSQYTGSHWRQAVVVLKHPVHVRQGDQVLVTVRLKGSSIILDVKKQ